MELWHCSAEKVYHKNSNTFSQINYFVSVKVPYGPDVSEQRARKGLQGQITLEGTESKGEMLQLPLPCTALGTSWFWCL